MLSLEQLNDPKELTEKQGMEFMVLLEEALEILKN